MGKRWVILNTDILLCFAAADINLKDNKSVTAINTKSSSLPHHIDYTMAFGAYAYYTAAKPSFS